MVHLPHETPDVLYPGSVFNSQKASVFSVRQGTLHQSPPSLFMCFFSDICKAGRRQKLVPLNNELLVSWNMLCQKLVYKLSVGSISAYGSSVVSGGFFGACFR